MLEGASRAEEQGDPSDDADRPAGRDPLVVPVDGAGSRNDAQFCAPGVAVVRLKPHLVRTFKVSTDPHFEEKLKDVVGLYLNPPENAAVFSFDEKSSIQALDRTQPGLPLKKGRAGTMTHDDIYVTSLRGPQ